MPLRVPACARSVLAGLALAAALSGVATRAEAAPPQILTSTLSDATAGAPYSQTLVASDGTLPYAWSLAEGTLPAGFTLDGGSGEIAGTSTLAATNGFVVRVTDALGDTASRAFTLAVNPAAAAQLSFVVGPVNTAVGATLTPAVQVKVADAFGNGVAGEPVALALVGSGTLSGGGTVVSDGGGLAVFAALSVDVAGSKQLTATSGALSPATSAAFDITCLPVTLAPASLPSAQAGVPYSQTLSASGGSAPYAFAVTSGALPAGLSLSTAGVLSGTTSDVGSHAFTVQAVSANGCDGSRAYTLAVPGVPAAVNDLAAALVTSGNAGTGRNAIALTFTPSTWTSSVEVYRAPFGGYPRYDDAAGVVPPLPSYPPGAPWQLTAVSASGQSDLPATRDVWHYVVFLKNEFGQVSAVSNRTAGMPDYALGDVSDGITAGQGDNLVSDLDLSLLGAHYGISGADILTAGVSYLDVGPTMDFGMTSRPFTDQRIDFEDFIVFATNYGAVSAPATVIAAADRMRRAARGPEHVWLEAPAEVAAGAEFDVAVELAGEGRLQGLSLQLAWDAGVAEPLGVSADDAFAAQRGMVMSSAPGVVDAALLAARTQGLSGRITLAHVRFRALRGGEPQLRIARLLGRDAANRPVEGPSLLAGSPREALGTRFAAPSPNPASGPSALRFTLATPGAIELAIYSVDGRRVRTLASGTFAAGAHEFVWHGDDAAAHPVAPGLYYAQLQTPGRTFTRKLVRLP